MGSDDFVFEVFVVLFIFDLFCKVGCSFGVVWVICLVLGFGRINVKVIKLRGVNIIMDVFEYFLVNYNDWVWGYFCVVFVDCDIYWIGFFMC